MITKESFVKLINAVIFQMEKDYKFSKSIEEFASTYCIMTISEEIIDVVIDVLEVEMNDLEKNLYGSFISWWLFDAPEAGKNKDSCYVETDKGKILLETPEQLYDFLVKDNE